jgi:transcription-repair coupling factor (superfamily II helicase)
MMHAIAKMTDVVKVLEDRHRSARTLSVTGLVGGARAYVSALVHKAFAPLLVITPDQDSGDVLANDMQFFLSRHRAEGVRIFPADGPLHADIFPWDLYARRMGVLRALVEERASVVVAPIQAVMERIITKEALRGAMVTLTLGMHYPRERLVRRLVSMGYVRETLVEERGEISVRGAILDIFSVDQELPFRIEFVADQVCSIRTFDSESQRLIEHVGEAVVTPAGVSGKGHLLEYFPRDAVVVLDGPDEVAVAALEFRDRIERLDKGIPHIDPEAVMSLMDGRTTIALGSWDSPTADDSTVDRVGVDVIANDALRHDIKTGGLQVLTEKLDAWLADRWAVYVATYTPGQARRMAELLEERGIETVMRDRVPEDPSAHSGYVNIVVGHLRSGFRLPADSVAIITEEEIFGRKGRAGEARKARPTALSNFEDLRKGNYVVHVDYGIGVYQGLVRLEGEGVENDYLLLRYEDNDKLYVPVDRLDLVNKYVGVGDQAPKLDRLGGAAWGRAKRKAKRAAERVARELVEIYAARKAFPGFAFGVPDAYYREFEAAFEYEETSDQSDAIGVVLNDMQRPKPMDRLICGDVGYGKTEVAMRAAFKAVVDGKQVAVLVPTTVLAQQHHVTFTRRFEGHPVVIDVLSRFKSPAQQQDTLAQLRQGKVDIIIGTHRLLQRDVEFRDLGLLVVDEEHRFGVTHKEKLKEMRKLVDCLTLTATPIPRTLQLSLTGIRDLSLITMPPPNRQSIATYIISFDAGVIRDAITREIQRGGQIFYVHNRVKDIERVADTVRDLVPEVRVEVAHGQMTERGLENVMVQFVQGTVDVLVCTSIIESGLDIPNANTIIIDGAERFGLADLYQIRGRVGRSAQKAYAYLVVPPRHKLSRDALRRMRAIQELRELGSGFRLAMRDLEIRGAGNLLGHVQSGHINDVGFELYEDLLKEAMQELKGEEVTARAVTELRLPVEAYIPADYIEDDTQRLLCYKRLSLVDDEAALEAIREELEDRYGPAPPQCVNLLDVIRGRVWLSPLAVRRFEFRDSVAIVTFFDGAGLSSDRMVNLVEQGQGKYRLTPDMQLRFQPDADDWRAVLSEARNVLRALV